MKIYLVQHGESFDKQTDPNRGLSPAGQEAIMKVANVASDADITMTTIYHSGKLRAQQTAELFLNHIKTTHIKSLEGIDPLDNVEDFVNHFKMSDNEMIVGHLPFMERLTSFLITGNQEQTVVKFQNAGIVCLEQNENDKWHVKWTIMPVIN